MTSIFHKRIQNEIKLYKKDNFIFPNLYLRPNTNNLQEWFFIVYDLKETLFENGIYFGKILLPNTYPLKPADFIFITPNGRFEVGKKICTSFSGFHPESHTSTWNILTMMQGIISFMTDKQDIQGLGFEESTDEQKRELAKRSSDWNKQNSLFKNIFEDFDNLNLI